MPAPHRAVTTTQPNASSPAESTAAKALAAAGDADSARDVGALDAAAKQAADRLGRNKKALVERLIYGPAPAADELQSGALAASDVPRRRQARPAPRPGDRRTACVRASPPAGLG